MLASGWTPRSTEELAIGAASHNGEDGHRELVAGMLAAVGLGPEHLGCPPALPMHEATRAQWLAEGWAPDRRPAPRSRPSSSTGAALRSTRSR
jgi:L-asparaginase II